MLKKKNYGKTFKTENNDRSHVRAMTEVFYPSIGRVKAVDATARSTIGGGQRRR